MKSTPKEVLTAFANDQLVWVRQAENPGCEGTPWRTATLVDLAYLDAEDWEFSVGPSPIDPVVDHVARRLFVRCGNEGRWPELTQREQEDWHKVALAAIEVLGPVNVELTSTRPDGAIKKELITVEALAQELMGAYWHDVRTWDTVPQGAKSSWLRTARRALHVLKVGQ